MNGVAPTPDQLLHPLTSFWDLALGNVKARVLALALDGDWFAVIDRYRVVEDIASILGRPTDWLRPLLDILWGLRLLEVPPEQPETYVLTRMARRYWLKSSPDYYGDAWWFRHSSLDAFSSALSTDEFVDASATEALRARWAEAANSHIAQEQAVLTAPQAVKVIRRLPEFERLRRFLDLGGGPGLVALQLAQVSEQLQGRVFDFPESAAVARDRIESANLSERLSVQGGDINSGCFGQGYDLIWISSVLHFVSDPLKTLAHIWQSLAPGGVLVAAHAELAEDAGSAQDTLAYFLPLRLRGRAVWPAGELEERLAGAGFVEIESYLQSGFPMVPLTIVIARRPLS